MELTRTQRLALGSSLAVVCLALGLSTLGRHHAPPANVSGAEPLPASAAVTEPASSVITVHVVGAVNQPGLVRLPPGARIWDAIAAAGGFSQAADAEALNLAATVPDGVQIVVPQRLPDGAAQWSQPAAADAATPQQPAPQAATDTAPLPEQPGVTSSWEGQTTQGDPSSQPSQPVTPSPAPYAAAASPSLGMPGLPARGGPRYPISLNQADQSQLEALPGVGPALAERIARYRAANGPFQRIEDLDNVRGIGPSTLAKIAPYVTL